MADRRYRFTRRFDAAVYLVTTPLQFVWIVLLFVTLPLFGWLAPAAAEAFVATVAANGIMFRRAGREVGTPSYLDQRGSHTGRPGPVSEPRWSGCATTAQKRSPSPDASTRINRIGEVSRPGFGGGFRPMRPTPLPTPREGCTLDATHR